MTKKPLKDSILVGLLKVILSYFPIKEVQINF